MKIDNCVSNEIISINGKNQLISSSESSHDLANDFNYFSQELLIHIMIGAIFLHQI